MDFQQSRKEGTKELNKGDNCMPLKQLPIFLTKYSSSNAGMYILEGKAMIW